MGDFLLSRILMFEVLEEELGDDRASMQPRQRFIPSTCCYVHMEKIRNEELFITCFFKGIVVQHAGKALAGLRWVLALLFHSPCSPL